jgi:hypothetical protein
MIFTTFGIRKTRNEASMKNGAALDLLRTTALRTKGELGRMTFLYPHYLLYFGRIILFKASLYHISPLTLHKHHMFVTRTIPCRAKGAELPAPGVNVRCDVVTVM